MGGYETSARKRHRISYSAPAGRHRTDKAASRTRRGRLWKNEMRPDPDTCTDPVLLAAEVRRLRAVIDSGESVGAISRFDADSPQAVALTDAERIRLAAYDEEISREMPPDFKDWWQNNKSEWPLIARLVLEGRRLARDEYADEVDRLLVQATLTDAEREAVAVMERVANRTETIVVGIGPRHARRLDGASIAATLRGLLERLG